MGFFEPTRLLRKRLYSTCPVESQEKTIHNLPKNDSPSRLLPIYPPFLTQARRGLPEGRIPKSHLFLSSYLVYSQVLPQHVVPRKKLKKFPIHTSHPDPLLIFFTSSLLRVTPSLLWHYSGITDTAKFSPMLPRLIRRLFSKYHT